MAEEQILYDLIVHEEWEQEPQLLDQVENFFWQYRGSLLKKLWKVSQGSFFYMLDTLKTQFRYQASFGCPPIHFITLMNHCLPWMVALSQDASLLAILEDSVIEIRTSSNYEQIISKCKVGKDAFPTWRKLVWNHDNTLLCYCNSFGDITIFDVTGAVKHQIPCTKSASLKVPGTLSLAVAFIEFIKQDRDSSRNHLYVCTYQGLLNVYEISDSTCKHLWSFSFVSYHPYGIACMVHDVKNNLLIAAGNYGKEPFPNIMGDECYGSHSAISMWRLLNDSPHLNMVEDRGKALKKISRREWLKNIVLRRGSEQNEMLKHGIFRMKLSQDGTQIVTLHLDGRISFWSVPSMRLIRTWSKSEQPDTGGSGDSGFSLDTQRKEDILKTPNVVNLNWWSDKDIVLVTGSGNLTIASCESLANLLGESSEKFDPWPCLSQVVDGGILVLECEKRVSDPSNKSKTASKKWLAEEDQEHEEMDSLRYRFKELSKQMLYFVTEAERFLPAVKPPRVLTNVYRLLCLKSTSPEELYARKINLEHYGEALDLAKRFGLNTDLVFQKQWRNKRVTKITIHDYLSKIKDREWVLDECVLRVPDDFDSTEQLLKYGLLGTSWELLHRIDDSDSDELPYNLKSKKQVDHVDEEVDDKIFSGSLTTKQIRLCKYRKQLLHYLDRLSTYEVILGGSFKARDKFSKEYFSKFRSCNIVHHAVESARDEDAYSLEHLFSYHGKQLLPYWLPILSNFPETADIRYFEQVIPELGEIPVDPEILPWLEKHHRDPDWVEQPTILNQITEEDENNLGDFIFEEEPDLRQFYKCETKNQLKEWFLHRVHSIDEISGQIDKCCELLNIGIQRGLPELKDLHKDFKTWSTLIYEVCIDSKMTARDFLKLSDTSKVNLLMSKSSDKTFVEDFETFLLPFLKDIGRKDYKKRQALLHEFLVEIAKTDLTCCLKLFEKCSPELKEPLLPDIGEIMRIAIDCIFACKRTDQLNQCFAIVECLPSRDEGVISRQIEQLHIELDQLEHLLIGAEILQHYKNPQPIFYIAETKTDSEVSKEIFHQLVKNMVCKGKCTAKDLNKLLDHIIRLSKEVFTLVDVKTAHEIFVKGLLRSGIKEHIHLAQELITPSKLGGLAKKQENHLTSALHLLKYDVSINVALEAAQEYYDSAMSLSDSSMELAKLCLSLIEDSPPPIQDEFDLINSLYLLNEFNVSMLPLQVRLSPDKLEIIDLCLKEKKNGYKKKDKLLQLSHLLKICGNEVKERTGQVHIKIAESAFEHKDYTSAGIMCVQLVDENYAPAWWICRKIGECTKYTNYTIRKKLLSFAMTYCPLHHIEDVLKEKTTLETQILYEKLSLHMKEDSSKVSEDKEQVDGNNQTSLLSKTTTKTKKLISSVADTRWIGSAINWVSINSDGKRESFDTSREVNQLIFHPFYKTLSGNKDTEKYNFEELSDHLKCVSNEKKLFNQLLLRSQKLSEHRSGEMDQESSEPAIQSLCEFAYSDDSCLCLAYMMAINNAGDVQAIHDKHNKNTFTFLFAAYFYALQEYVKTNAIEHNGKAEIYAASPKEVISWLLGVLGREKSTNKKELDENVSYFLSNMNKLQDLMQAKMLQALDKGVDIGRFAVDDEYKRETILGLAMSLEDELINTSLLLADKYDIPSWEVMLSHVEFLFTDSGLKAKAIRESLTKWKIENFLKPHGDEVFERMKKYVYPEINGKDHNALLLFYVFVLNCSSANKILEGTLTLDAHSKLLKKIKAAAPSMNYKELVHGDSPLDVIRDCVDDNNVHLLAKIACKIPQADGTYLAPNTIFLANAIRMFWKKGENKNWINQFENCKQYFVKLKVNDVVTLADQITFADEAFASLNQEVRCDISNRILKYLRQQKGQEEVKQVANENFDTLMEQYQTAIQHMEMSVQHLKTLSQPAYQNILSSKEEPLVEFAKRYDLSRGNQDILEDNFKDMFLTQQPLSVINSIHSLCTTYINVKRSFQAALKCLLTEVQEHKDFSILSSLIADIEDHQKSNEENSIVTTTDLLEVVRPFCSDVTVSTEVKSSLLSILKDSVKLADDDLMLLHFYQTQSIIEPAWGFEISEEEINTWESRLTLFDKLLGMASNKEQTLGLEKLLSSWPTFSKEGVFDDETCPWIRLILKKVEIEDSQGILKLLSKAKSMLTSDNVTQSAYDSVYEQLTVKNNVIMSCKWMLSSDYVECYERLFEDLTTVEQIDSDDVDSEFVSLILTAGTLHRFTEIPFYADVVDRIIFDSDNKQSIKQAVSQLRENGCEAEAGTLIMKTKDMKQSFFTLNNALDILKFKFRS